MILTGRERQAVLDRKTQLSNIPGRLSEDERAELASINSCLRWRIEDGRLELDVHDVSPGPALNVDEPLVMTPAEGEAGVALTAHAGERDGTVLTVADSEGTSIMFNQRDSIALMRWLMRRYPIDSLGSLEV